MLALGEEETVGIAGERLQLARDGSGKTVINDAHLTCLHVCAHQSPHDSA